MEDEKRIDSLYQLSEICGSLSTYILVFINNSRNRLCTAQNYFSCSIFIKI
jgi:hypothetical protein